MSVAIIVMGAAGRMGGTVSRMVAASGDLRLAALVERPEHHGRVLTALGENGDPIPLWGRVEDALAEHPGAVVIDFTAPEASVMTARAAAASGSPVVIGTTGFTLEQRNELEHLAVHSPLFLSPNMSVGINVLLEILPRLASLLGDAYDGEVMEIHHSRKKDAPSGTALRLAEALADGKGWDLAETGRYCRKGIIGERPHREIGVQSLRGGDVVGVHTVYFFGPGERIELTHHAHSRENFAGGALRAARWIAEQKPGRLYTMSDVLMTAVSHETSAS